MSAIEIPVLNVSTFLPQIVVTATAVVILLLELFKERVERINLTLLTLIGLALAYVTTQWLQPSTEPAFAGMVIRDGLSIFLDKLFLFGAALVVLLGHRLSDQMSRSYGEYLVLLLFALLGMMCITVSADLVLLFIGIELVSICLYIMTGMDKKSLLSGEASMKYFLLGAFSTGFLVYGMAFVFGLCQTTNLITIASTIDESILSSPLLALGFALILVGLGFKISLAPFHMWAPDVYQGAPTPVTSWIATGSKMAGFIALVRIFSLPNMSFEPLSELWVHAVWILSLLTMILGNAGALVQKDIKRLLAYSSVAHGGYLSMAFVSHNEIGLQALLFYLAAYLFMTLGAFGVVFAIRQQGKECTTIQQYAGLAKTHPFLAGLMALFLLSLAGMPPTAGFIGKVWLFGAAIQAEYYFLAIVGILTTLLSFYYYLWVIVAMWMREPESDVTFDQPAISNTLSIMISAVCVLIFGIFPNLIMNVIANGALGS